MMRSSSTQVHQEMGVSSRRQWCTCQFWDFAIQKLWLLREAIVKQKWPHIINPSASLSIFLISGVPDLPTIDSLCNESQILNQIAKGKDQTTAQRAAGLMSDVSWQTNKYWPSKITDPMSDTTILITIFRPSWSFTGFVSDSFLLRHIWGSFTLFVVLSVCWYALWTYLMFLIDAWWCVRTNSLGS